MMAWRLRRQAIRDEIAGLDPRTDHARIVTLFSGHEFLWDLVRSLELALFRTFASPSISQLLDHTRQFSGSGQKRYDDTTLLILAMIREGYDSPAGERAITQMNAIHARYRIPNDDFLFVLSTFVLDPIDWIERFGWRRLTAAEQESLFLVWMNIGQRMGIEDVPESLEAMRRGSEAYVAEHFRFAECNVRVANATLKIMEDWLPRGLRGQVKRAACALLDARTLEAFGYERPSRAYQSAVFGALQARAAMLRRVDVAPVPNWPDGRRTYPEGYALERVGPEAVLAAMGRAAVVGENAEQ